MALRLTSLVLLFSSFGRSFATDSNSLWFLASRVDFSSVQSTLEGFGLSSSTPSDDSFSKWCVLPNFTDQSQNIDIKRSNCFKVRQAEKRFKPIVEGSLENEWQDRLKTANQLCDQCHGLNENTSDKEARECAQSSLEAWGNQIMRQRECCNNPNPPFCFTQGKGSHFAPLLLVMLVCFVASISKYLFKGSVSAPAYLNAYYSDRPAEVDSAPQLPAGLSRMPTLPPDLRGKLEGIWKKTSLRHLPSAEVWGTSSVELFLALCETYGFQPQSCENQFEHLVSLWRSHISVVADRRYEGEKFGHRDDRDPDLRQEATNRWHAPLLKEGLEELHADLLAGFRLWRERLQTIEVIQSASTRSLPMGNARWAARDNNEKVERQNLPEVAMFLLVWSEGGNLRFMPELICFITELALLAKPGPTGDVYNEWMKRSRSSPFLVNVVRPIYNYVFKENYEKVEGDQKKVLKSTHQKYLPEDCINYDDWNELFCDTERMKNELVLKDGQKLFDLPAEDRFQALSRMDWAKSLGKSKTHRELHSSWGLFAATHRVWFLHAFLYCLAMWIVNEPWNWPHDHAEVEMRVKLAGNSPLSSLSTVFLIVPIHALLWKKSRWFTRGRAIRDKIFASGSCCDFMAALFGFMWRLGAWMVPVITYGLVRYMEFTGEDSLSTGISTGKFKGIVAAHVVVSSLGAIVILFFPAHAEDKIFEMTPISWEVKSVRWSFWLLIIGAKFGIGLIMVGGINTACKHLHIVRPGQEAVEDLLTSIFTPGWDKDVLQWLALFGTGFLTFCADTQFWVVFGASVLGGIVALKQRLWQIRNLALEAAIMHVPERMSEKVFMYCHYPRSQTQRLERNPRVIADEFFHVWDRIVRFMYEEDKIDQQTCAQMAYIHPRNIVGELSHARVNTGEDVRNATTPLMFQEGQGCCVGVGHVSRNKEVKWRLAAMSRAMTMEMPRPFRAPFFPGLTVMIPHYGDSIHQDWLELYKGVIDFTYTWEENRSKPLAQKLEELRLHEGLSEDDWGRNLKVSKLDRSNPPAEFPVRVRYTPGTKQNESRELAPLIHWIKRTYKDEFANFGNRMATKNDKRWQSAGENYGQYNHEQWDTIATWSSMRSQTLIRTVAGMCLYHAALDCHWELQREKMSVLAKKEVWDASELFTCLVTMQIYPTFKPNQYRFTNKMLKEMPKSFKIAYIDVEAKGDDAEAKQDNIHDQQQRRYYSCIIDKDCGYLPAPKNLRRIPRLRIELPGFPILGDGKGDNQNHAVPFTRGSIIQCVDANQGAYFEQMLLLPCVLGEFRKYKPSPHHQSRRPQLDEMGLARKIVGFPEHITSDIGSVGSFAAAAETAFGTTLQRAYAVLGCRMHYGHPDMMNKTFMIQQGGVSKATKTVNLSEDIFAGMDFTLRGDGRTIHHAEYFHVSKGRDLGFGTVLTFFAKLSSGTGEQVLTRQMFRLGHVLGLGEFLGFYYAHAGYYIGQHLLSKCVPLFTAIWLLVILDDPEGDFKKLDPEGRESFTGAEVMSTLLSKAFSTIFLLFIFVQVLPVFLEIWFQQGIFQSFRKLVTMMLTLSPMLFVFQAKIIGIYVTSEILYGGAGYLATGRGLPTDRRPFFKPGGGTYQDWAQHAFYDGFRLMCCWWLAAFCGGLFHVKEGEHFNTALSWWCIASFFTIVSWLYAPFVFNPYQFDSSYFMDDLADWKSFFFKDKGKHWKEWHDETQMRPAGSKTWRGIRSSIPAILAWVIPIGCWYTVLNSKMYLLSSFVENTRLTSVTALMPPVFGSLLFCCIVPLILKCAEWRDWHVGWYALGVILLDTAEAFVSLRLLFVIKWWKTLVAGIVLKYLMLSFALLCADCLMRLKYEFPAPVKRALELLKNWVHAHRLAFDLVVSSFLFMTLAVFYGLDRVRSICFKNYTLHNLIVYREAEGYDARQVARRYDTVRDNDSLASTSGIHSDIADDLEATLSMQGMSQPTPPPQFEVSHPAAQTKGSVNAEKLFRQLDVNKDGDISRDELFKVLFENQAIKKQLRLERYEDVMAFLDEASSGGYIDLEGWTRALKARGLTK